MKEALEPHVKGPSSKLASVLFSLICITAKVNSVLCLSLQIFGNDKVYAKNVHSKEGKKKFYYYLGKEIFANYIK